MRKRRILREREKYQSNVIPEIRLVDDSVFVNVHELEALLVDLEGRFVEPALALTHLQSEIYLK